jgi:hypothetical protein
LCGIGQHSSSNNKVNEVSSQHSNSNHHRRLLAGIIAGLLVLLLPAFGFIVYAARSNGDSELLPLLFLLLVFALLPIGLLLWILIPGPFCQTRLRTSVQDIRLPGLFRLKVAREFVATLRNAAPLTPTPTPNPSATPDPAA